MAIEEGELRAATVQVGVNKIRRAHRGQILAIEQPHDCRMLLEGANLHIVIGCAGIVDVLVKAVMEKIICLAA